jgi:hypothetical protein
MCIKTQFSLQIGINSMGEDPLHLLSSPFLPFEKIKTHKKSKVINHGGTHFMVGPTTYFMCQSLSKLHTSIYFLNGEDLHPNSMVLCRWVSFSSKFSPKASPDIKIHIKFMFLLKNSNFFERHSYNIMSFSTKFYSKI